MTPLDLTKAPPRSPRGQLRGLCILPRMIDTARAMLPDGNVGEYQIGRGMSGAVFSAFGISAPQFVDVVRGAFTDDDVAECLWSHSSVPAAAFSRHLARLTVADVPDELRADFLRFYGTEHPSDRCVFDLLEADDARAFTKGLTKRCSLYLRIGVDFVENLGGREILDAAALAFSGSGATR